ncbi:hypothetical protein WISP_65771 [Willisornis vidua]|uniref:Uncharacterized protein n=1 Tax=Willisornis vidua TaxID=1566151 RepID=A0ABQ9DF67_9PASS|nr:hypothetical protein WISP_65771 [Willisornis vidua]
MGTDLWWGKNPKNRSKIKIFLTWGSEWWLYLVNLSAVVTRNDDDGHDDDHDNNHDNHDLVFVVLSDFLQTPKGLFWGSGVVVCNLPTPGATDVAHRAVNSYPAVGAIQQWSIELSVTGSAASPAESQKSLQVVIPPALQMLLNLMSPPKKTSSDSTRAGAPGIEGDRVADVGCSESCQQGMINEHQLQLSLTFGEPSRTSAELSELDKDRAEQPIIPPSLRTRLAE